MLLQVVSIKDVKTQAFSQPSFVPTVGSAVRSFQDLMANPESMCAKHPEDFEMYKIGTFDDELGYLQPKMVQISDDGATAFQPELIARAIDYVVPDSK